VSTSALEQAGTLACLFEVAHEMFAVEIGHAREARIFRDYTQVPLGPLPLVGMTNLRGAIIPIVDLRLLLGLPSSVRLGQTLVVEAEGVRAALTVDRVVGVEALEALPDRPARWPMERGCLRRGDAPVPVLDVPKILEALVQDNVKEGKA
jgi:chemotaxis signal transduction protein